MGVYQWFESIDNDLIPNRFVWSVRSFPMSFYGYQENYQFAFTVESALGLTFLGA